MKEWLITFEEDEAYRALVHMTLARKEFGEVVWAGVRDWFGFVDRVRQAIVGLVREGIDTGEIHPEADPEVTGLALVSYLNGVEETWFLQQLSLQESRFSPAHMADDLVEFILRGVTNRAQL